MGLSLGGILGIAAAPFTGGASLALTAADLTNSAAADAADKNRDFQQYNSDTAIQRRVKDYQAAGLNPMLATEFGGASQPTGAVANTADYGQAMNSATAARSTNSQIDLQKAQVANTNSATQLNSANVAKSKADTLASVATANNQNAQAAKTAVDTKLNLQRLPAEQNSAAAANTWFGRNVTPYIKDVGNLIHSGNAAAGR